MVFMVARCQNIIILPAQNSLKVFVPFFTFINLFFNRKLFYSVVGGWLPDFLEKNGKLLKKCQKLNGIFVETESMMFKLNSIGVNNVLVIPNFKYLVPLQQKELSYSIQKPYRICTFSRVMKEKGIEDIIAAIEKINECSKSIIFQLDIYGKVDDGYVVEFKKMKEKFPKYIQYAGMVEPNQSIEIIRDYFALIFPTRYYTEGVPGTLIDACMAGVPVISAKWGNYRDVLIENKTGWGYEFGNQEALLKILKRLVASPEEFVKMKGTTLEEARRYMPKCNIEKMTQYFD